jgi:hypothetical protein
MDRGEKSRAISAVKEEARKTQRKLQDSGLSKRTAEKSAWEQANRTGRGTRSSGTAGGRSKVSKRTLSPKGSTSKSKTTGKTRR